MASRKHRLAAIRARLQALLATDAPERIDQARGYWVPPGHDDPQMTAARVELRIRIDQALIGCRIVEKAQPEERATQHWRQWAEFEAARLEHLWAWMEAGQSDVF